MSVSAVWYFAWVDVDTDGNPPAFDPEVHNVQDTELLAFTFSQHEAEFAALRLLTRNPISGVSNWALGLLGPERKRWAWFAWSLNGAEPSPLALVRLVGIPTDVFGATVTLDFSARPPDFNEQKAALNETMRVLPYWAPGFIDEQKRENMDIVLDTYAGVWYVDPVTHVTSLSDLLFGEDGTEVFNSNEHAESGLQFTLGDPPLTAVSVDAEMVWTQRAVGTIPMSLVSSSYTLNANALPHVGASLGDGWKVQSADITGDTEFETKNDHQSFTININWPDGGKMTSTESWSSDYIVRRTKSAIAPDASEPESGFWGAFPPLHPPQLPGPILGDGRGGAWAGGGSIITDYKQHSSYSERDESGDPPQLTSWGVSVSWTTNFIPNSNLEADYLVGYDVERPFTEHVTFTMKADVQRITTDPDEDEVMRLDGLHTADLSDPIDGVPPIGDPRRRSFVTQDIGLDYIRYLLLLARAQLRKRSRAVEISFSPFLTRLADLKLNRNAQVFDWRIPGGNAIGKIIAFTLTLTPPQDDGEASINLECTIGCAIGNGGTVSVEGGEEEYVDDEYIDQSEDYQQYIGAILTFNDEMGFTPPLFEPDDDGLDFITPFGSNDPSIFAVPIAINNPASVQSLIVDEAVAAWPGAPGVGTDPEDGTDSGTDDGPTWQEQREQMVLDQAAALADMLAENETEISFKLKSTREEFRTEVPIIVTVCKIPQMINLGAV